MDKLVELGAVLGEAIAEVRRSKEVTQEELAGAVEISPRSLQRFEAGQDFPKYTTLFKIALALEVEPDIFIQPMWVSWKESTDT